jgi:nicotinate-nucleotide adenylyltransferase
VIGIYGGTFDPIHNGHLHVIKELLLSRRIDRIIVLPAGDPQLRERPMASAVDRLAMCSAALASLGTLADRVEVSAMEVERDRPSYAIESVRQLQKENPAQEFAWIIGSDAYRKIGDWHESEVLQDLISFIVVERPENAQGEVFDDFDTTEINALDISATQIRKKIGSGQEVSALLPTGVLSYIESKGLYGSA